MSLLYNTLCNILQNINKLLWGKAAIILIFAASAFLTVKCGFIQFRHPLRILKSTLFASRRENSAKKTGISRFQALSTALAASMGTGNIIGVASAIAIGGCGAVFWMALSAFFVMSFAFAENVLGVKYKAPQSEGPMPYIEKAFGSKKAAAAYAAACMLASFGIGSMAQANSVSSSLGFLGADVKTAAVISAVIVGAIIFRGGKFIAGLAEKIIPFASLVYILGTLAIIALNADKLPSALTEIFTSALGFRQAAGGLAGTAISTGLRRGLFSNEAGMGSSVFAHTSADCDDPEVMGMWAVLEVFIDTVLCCTLTALAILCTGADSAGLGGAETVIEAFRRCFGNFSVYFVSGANIVFAFASVLGWYFYGEKCACYLSEGTLLKNSYRLFYAAAVYFGAVCSLNLIWEISDILNAAMLFPNLISLIILSGEIKMGSSRREKARKTGAPSSPRRTYTNF